MVKATVLVKNDLTPGGVPDHLHVVPPGNGSEPLIVCMNVGKDVLVGVYMTWCLFDCLGFVCLVAESCVRRV